MTTLDFGKRYLNHNADVVLINEETEGIIFEGQYIDCPYRLLRFSNFAKLRGLDEDEFMIIVVRPSSGQFYSVPTK
jgi:hypothetical protein